MHAMTLPSERSCADSRLRRRKPAVDDGAVTDEAALSRVAQGDRDAFVIIFNRYASRVKGYLMRLGASARLSGGGGPTKRSEEDPRVVATGST